MRLNQNCDCVNNALLALFIVFGFAFAYEGAKYFAPYIKGTNWVQSVAQPNGVPSEIEMDFETLDEDVKGALESQGDTASEKGVALGGSVATVDCGSDLSPEEREELACFFSELILKKKLAIPFKDLPEKFYTRDCVAELAKSIERLEWCAEDIGEFSEAFFNNDPEVAATLRGTAQAFEVMTTKVEHLKAIAKEKGEDSLSEPEALQCAAAIKIAAWWIDRSFSGVRCNDSQRDRFDGNIRLLFSFCETFLERALQYQGREEEWKPGDLLSGCGACVLSLTVGEIPESMTTDPTPMTMELESATTEPKSPANTLALQTMFIVSDDLFEALLGSFFSLVRLAHNTF